MTGLADEQEAVTFEYDLFVVHAKADEPFVCGHLGPGPARSSASEGSSEGGLWNVNDSSAPQLMREFYGDLARGTGRAQALRQAKLRILNQKRIAHPYYWAAFI